MTKSRASFFPQKPNTTGPGSIPDQEVLFKGGQRRNRMTITKTGISPVTYWAQSPQGVKVKVAQQGQNFWAEI